MRTPLGYRLTVLALGFLAAVAVAPSPARAIYETSCSSCKSSVFVRETHAYADAFDQLAYLEGFLLKGKKHQVLRVEGTASITTVSAGVMDCSVTVNSYVIEGGALFGIDHGTSCQGNGTTCLFTGTYWLDLDAAELAHPGTYVNQPLDVVFHCSSFGNAGQPFGMSMSAEMVKK